MARKMHAPEQIINKLREAEVALVQGSTVAQASRLLAEPAGNGSASTAAPTAAGLA